MTATDGTTLGGVRFDPSPSVSCAAIGPIAGIAAIGAVANSPAQLATLGVELVGLLVLLASSGAANERSALGNAGVLAGGALVVVAVGLGAVAPVRLTETLELLPGMVGVGLLCVGVLPVGPGPSRRIVGLGGIALGGNILTSGVIYGAGELSLLVGMALAVVSWDAAEQALNLGEQVGRAGATPLAVLGHTGWSAVVGVVGIAAASAVYGVGVTGLPLVGLGLLLASAIALAIAAFS